MSAKSFELSELIKTRDQAGERYLEFLNVPSMRVGISTLGVGANHQRSAHTQDEVYYVLKGSATLRAGDREMPLQAGSVAYVAAHVEHHFHSVRETLEVLVFFSTAS